MKSNILLIVSGIVLGLVIGWAGGFYQARERFFPKTADDLRSYCVTIDATCEINGVLTSRDGP